MVKTLLRLSWLRGAGGGVLLRLAGGGFTENFVAAVRSIQTGFAPGLEKLPAVLLGKNEAAATSRRLFFTAAGGSGLLAETF